MTVSYVHQYLSSFGHSRSLSFFLCLPHPFCPSPDLPFCKSGDRSYRKSQLSDFKVSAKHLTFDSVVSLPFLLTLGSLAWAQPHRDNHIGQNKWSLFPSKFASSHTRFDCVPSGWQALYPRLFPPDFWVEAVGWMWSETLHSPGRNRGVFWTRKRSHTESHLNTLTL